MNIHYLEIISYVMTATGIILFAISVFLILKNNNTPEMYDVKASYEKYYGEAKDSGGETKTATLSDAENVEDMSELSEYNIDDVDSILMIPAIELSGPVYTGCDRMSHLDDFAFITGYEENTYGEGAYYIFGHQSKTYGKSFNRIKELSEGDEIVINHCGILYYYRITSIDFTYDMEIDKSPGLTDKLYIFTCDKSTKRNKPYIKITAEKE